LTDEFSRQASLESDLKIPSSLAVTPTKGSALALARSQIGFMNLFAAPLFQSVADIMPEMSFGINEIKANLDIWKVVINDCTENGDKPFVHPKPINGADVSKTLTKKLSNQAMDIPEKYPSQTSNGAPTTPPRKSATVGYKSPPLNATVSPEPINGRSRSVPRHVESTKSEAGRRTPESADDQPVYTVLVTNHQDNAEKSSIPRSPQSPELVNGVINGNGLDADEKSFVSQTPYVIILNPFEFFSSLF